MLQNPYTPGEVPRVFVGRDAELELVRSRLRRVVEDGEMGGPPLVVTGPRGLGKTSLLRHAEDEAQAQGFVTAWLACVRDAPFLPDLVSAVARALQRADVTDTGWRARLQSLEVQVGVPGVSVTAGYDADAAVSAPAGRVSAVEDLLHDAARTVRDRGGAGLLLLVDELHAGDLGDLAVLLNAAQNLAGRRQDNPVAVVGAGLPSTPGHLTKAATFGERSSFVPLDRLDERAAADVLVSPAAEVGVPWSASALHLVEAGAGGYPYFLQLLGSATWDAARPERGDTLTDAHARQGAAHVRGQVTAMFQARWEAAPDLERDFMRAMASHPTERVPRSHIASQMQRPTQALGVPRDRLIDKGIIEPDGHGHLRFTLPGFARYVREEANPSSDPNLDDTVLDDTVLGLPASTRPRTVP